jgi:hypothetical protein
MYCSKCNAWVEARSLGGSREEEEVGREVLPVVSLPPAVGLRRGSRVGASEMGEPGRETG